MTASIYISGGTTVNISRMMWFCRCIVSHPKPIIIFCGVSRRAFGLGLLSAPQGPSNMLDFRITSRRSSNMLVAKSK